MVDRKHKERKRPEAGSRDACLSKEEACRKAAVPSSREFIDEDTVGLFSTMCQ